jgi:HEAT repeat protein
LLWWGAIGLSLAVLALSVVGTSLWVEDRFPSEAGDPSKLTTRAQLAVTKPIADALARQAQRYVRGKMRKAWLLGGYSEQELLDRLLSPTITRNERRLVGYRLASAATPEAIAGLLRALEIVPPEDRAFFVQLVGSAGGLAVKATLLPLLDDSDERVVIAAIRGLSAAGGADASMRLGEMLADANRTTALRAEAALGLGDIGTAAAHDTLLQALSATPEPEVSKQIINGLGKFPFSRVAGTFEHLLSAPSAPQEMRVTAVEALVNSTPEAVPFLLRVAAGDSSPEVRASSAWAISAHEPAAGLAASLSDLANREPEPDVRRRIYEALVPQPGVPAAQLLPRVLAETDVAARVAGFNALGSAVSAQAGSSAASSFDAELVPELQRIASEQNSLNLRMRAVFALRRAQTSAAREALASIAASTNVSSPQIAAAARNGLSPRP